MSARLPTADERAFLDTVLGHSFRGVDQLRQQWQHALVESSCGCGCGSIGFVFDADFHPTPSEARSPLPVQGEIVGASGEIVGGIIVLLRDGLLDDVDVHSVGNEPLPFPAPASIRWCT